MVNVTFSLLLITVMCACVALDLLNNDKGKVVFIIVMTMRDGNLGHSSILKTVCDRNVNSCFHDKRDETEIEINN